MQDKNFTLIIAEDDASTRIILKSYVEELFAKVFVAKDGLEAIKIYEKNHIDFIITDINMPNMNGIDLIKNIRKNDKEVTILISSSLDDKEHFLKAIEYNVFRYIIKPPKKDVIQKILKNSIDDLLTKKELDKLKSERVSFMTIKSLLDVSPLPIIICKKSEIFYANKEANDLYKGELSTRDDISKIFLKKEGYLSNVTDYDYNDQAKNRVIIKGEIGRRIFQLYKSHINLNENNELNILFFINITMLEYQKQKAINLTNLLIKDFMERKKEEQIQVVEKEKEVITIDNREKNILRKDHSNKNVYTALEYVEELDEDTLMQLEDLDELQRDISDILNDFQESWDQMLLLKFSTILQHYNKTIKLLFAFEDLSLALNNLINKIEQISSTNIDQSKKEQIYLYLKAITDDLASWYRTIFVDKSAQDIHYLDSALFANCMQFDMLFSSKDKEVVYSDGDDDDFELF